MYAGLLQEEPAEMHLGVNMSYREGQPMPLAGEGQTLALLDLGDHPENPFSEHIKVDREPWVTTQVNQFLNSKVHN